MAKKRYYKYIVTISIVNHFMHKGGREFGRPMFSNTELSYYALNKSHAVMQFMDTYIGYNTNYTYRYFTSIIEVVKTKDYRYFEQNSF